MPPTSPAPLPVSSLMTSLQTIITRSSAAGASAGSGSDDGRPLPPSPPAVSPFEQGIINFCSLFTKLFPLWCVLAAVAGFYHPPLFTWFDTTMTSNGLMFIMVRVERLGLGHNSQIAEILPTAMVTV